LQVHQGGPVGSGVLGQLGSRCCSCRRWRCCGWTHSRCVVAFGVFPTGYFAHLRRFGIRSCAWMCFGVFSMGYFLALGGLQREPGWSWAGPHCPCRAPPTMAELALRHAPRTGPGIWRCGAGVVRSGGLLGVKKTMHKSMSPGLAEVRAELLENAKARESAREPKPKGQGAEGARKKGEPRSPPSGRR
jgi:hypothetical protein